tara:strand:- start:43 stop:534 length:492 start_codon:yes stop_codon:yes gene_type:complete
MKANPNRPASARTHSRSRLEAEMQQPQSAPEELFAAHCAWISQVRAQHEQMLAAQAAAAAATSAQHANWAPMGAAAWQPQLHERFDAGLELDDVDGPVYRSLSAGAWQPANDELDFDHDEPVYRSLGGVLDEQPSGGAAPLANDWAMSMPPLVSRQRAFHDRF